MLDTTRAAGGEHDTITDHVEPTPARRELARTLIGSLNDLSNHDYALELQRHDPDVAALRPAEVRGAMDWASRPALDERGLLTTEDLAMLHEDFVALIGDYPEDSDEFAYAIERWRNESNWVEYFVNRAQMLSEPIVSAPRLAALGEYYRDALDQLAHSRVLQHPENTAALGRSLDMYDMTLGAQRERQKWVRDKIGPRRLGVAAILAVRQTYRAVTYLPAMIGSYLYSEHVHHNVTPEDVRKWRGRKLKTTAILGAVGLYVGYQSARGILAPIHFEMGDPTNGNPSEVPVVAPGEGGTALGEGAPQVSDLPEPQPTEPTADYESGAYVIESGEGWEHQLNEMGINFTPEFMDFIWPDLEPTGYGYSETNPTTGHVEYFINEEDGRMPRDLLDLITAKYAEFKAV